MALTILEALQSANMNLDNMRQMGFALLPLIKAQVNNAVTLLEKGYRLDDLIEPLLEQYGDVDSVPEKIG